MTEKRLAMKAILYRIGSVCVGVLTLWACGLEYVESLWIAILLNAILTGFYYGFEKTWGYFNREE